MLSALKNFGVTFLIAAILFGILAYFATGFVTGTVKNILEEEQNKLDEIIQGDDKDPPNSDINDDPDHPDDTPEGESFNFIIFATDYRPDLYDTYHPSLSKLYETDWNFVPSNETTGILSSNYRKLNLSSIMMVRIDKEKKQVVYSYLTPETLIYTPSGYHTLSEIYILYGKKTVLEYINSMTGLKFKYSLVLDGYNMDELMELLGPINVRSVRDIYHDGMYSTMEYETTIEHTSADGSTWIEHIPNKWLQSAGDVTLDGNRLFNMITVNERSMADFNAKSAYVIEIIQAYLEKIAVMEDTQRKILLAKFITRDTEWENIENMYDPPEETEPEETEPEETDDPLESGDSTETKPDETEPETEPEEK